MAGRTAKIEFVVSKIDITDLITNLWNSTIKSSIQGVTFPDSILDSVLEILSSPENTRELLLILLTPENNVKKLIEILNPIYLNSGFQINKLRFNATDAGKISITAEIILDSDKLSKAIGGEAFYTGILGWLIEKVDIGKNKFFDLASYLCMSYKNKIVEFSRNTLGINLELEAVANVVLEDVSEQIAVEINN